MIKRGDREEKKWVKESGWKLRAIVLTAVLMLAIIITVFAIPTMAEKSDISEVGSHYYYTANLSAVIGELYSDTWYYRTIDNCYNEHFPYGLTVIC